MKEEVDRELNRMQAGGWLKMMDEEDERIQAIKDGLDKTIEECDELDGLLTLYLVELGVSFLHFYSTLLTVLDAHRGHCIYRSPITRLASPNCKPKASPGRAQIAP